MAAVYVHAIERAVYGPEKESAADHRALDLCLQAGYDGRKCLRVFEILSQHALDLGDTQVTFGLETNDEDDEAAEMPCTSRLRTWVWERMRGYPSLQERREALERYLDFRTAKPIPQRRPGFS